MFYAFVLNIRSHCWILNLMLLMSWTLLCRAAQKLGKKKKRHHQQEPDLPQYPTKFNEVIKNSPPPAPPCLLRAAGRLQQPGIGKVLANSLLKNEVVKCVHIFVSLAKLLCVHNLSWCPCSGMFWTAVLQDGKREWCTKCLTFVITIQVLKWSNHFYRYL